MTTITLAAGDLRLSIAPDLGAGIADFSIKGPTGFYFPLMRRAAPGETNASLLASFFMAPWVNRISIAAFTFRDRRHTLRPTTAEGTAQHGDVRRRPWQVTERSDTHISLTFDSRGVTDSNWPWSYKCRAVYSLDPSGFTIDLTVTNTDSQPFPAGCGHHPYFMRRLWDDRDDLEVRANVAARYPLKDGCATGPAAADALTEKLRALAPIPRSHTDAVFRGFAGEAELRWPASGITLRMTASPRLGHLLLFVPHAPPAAGGSPLAFIALEPQSQVNDALNLNEDAEPGTVVLEPGASLETRCRFEVIREPM